MRRFQADPELMTALAPSRLAEPIATLSARQPVPALETMRRLVAGEPVKVRKPSLWWRVRQTVRLALNGSYLIPLYAKLARRCGLMVQYSSLYLRAYHADGSITEYGLGSRRLVTDAGVAYLCADMNNASGSSDISLFKFHGFGSGTTAESAAQTALVTEYTTEYATDNVRPTGSQANSTNTYTSVGTFSPDATVTVSEHSLFTVATVGSGTMWDRSKFTGVALTGSADSLAATYVATFPSGG